MRRLSTLSWCQETDQREPDCLRSLRRQITRIKRFQRLRGVALICLVGVASGYLGTHLDSIKAMADSGGRIDDGAVTAPGYVMVLDEAQEAAATPLAASGSQAIDVSAGCSPDGPQGETGCAEEAPAWRSSLAPAAEASAGPSEPPEDPGPPTG